VAEPRAYVLVRRVRISNFKSIQDVALDLRPGVNVLVGPNASGKTNILEAIAFMRRALIDAAERIPYRPHVPSYWSPLDIIYGRDPSRTLMLGLDLTYYWQQGLKDNRKWVSTDIGFSFEMAYNHVADTIEPIRYTLRIGDARYYTRLEIRRESIEIATSIESFKRLREEAERVREEAERILGIMSKDFGKLVEETMNKYKVSGNEARLIVELKEPLPRPLLPRSLFWRIRGVGFSESDIGLGFEELLLPGISVAIPFVAGLRQVSKPEGLPALHIDLFHLSLSVMGLSGILASLIPRVLSRIVLARHPDIGAIGEPTRFTGNERLDERARNLAEVLLVLRGRLGGFPERVERALRELFPGMSIRVETRFGRVVLVGEENGVELPPPCLPDGLVKLVALMVAAELGPSILLVDEVENSMHARLLEYVIDEFNGLGVPVLVATHSPIVVDLVGPERVLIVRKSDEKGTVVERIREVEELRQRLVEEGIALSDYVFYGETYGEEARAP